MSRSCQRATFSIPVWAQPRSRRAMPQMRSHLMGFRLWGIALEPFCPLPKGSKASPTSVRWRCRTSVAIRSIVHPRRASAFSTSACRSRWRIWLETSAGARPKSAQTRASSSGGQSA